MLTFLPEGVLPNTERLKNGTVTNRDGHGWAIVVLNEEGQGIHILTGHSMNADAAIEAFRLTREKHPQGPALFHSRYTTGGVVDESNCHPYQVLRDPRTILAHNGILPFSLTEQDHDDTRSDTKYFAEEYGGLLYPEAAQRFPGLNYNLRSRRGRRRLSRWLGRGNKFVILTVDPAFNKSSYLINGDQGVWEDDGCWYSNTGYIKSPPFKLGRYTGTRWDSDAEWDHYYSSYSSVNTKRWWEDAASSETKALTAVASGTRGFTSLTDKGQHDTSDTFRPGAVCTVCAAKEMVSTLGYCVACGTCLDCGGDCYVWAEVGACICLWPTGTHPGKEAWVREAFGAEPESRQAADAPPGEATAVVLGADRAADDSA